MTHLAQRDVAAEPYFFRTSDQQEIDLVLDIGGRLWAVEVKLSSNPDPDAMRRLGRVADLIDARKRILISRTPRSVANDREVSCSLPWLLRNFDRLV